MNNTFGCCILKFERFNALPLLETCSGDESVLQLACASGNTFQQSAQGTILEALKTAHELPDGTVLDGTHAKFYGDQVEIRIKIVSDANKLEAIKKKVNELSLPSHTQRSCPDLIYRYGRQRIDYQVGLKLGGAFIGPDGFGYNPFDLDFQKNLLNSLVGMAFGHCKNALTMLDMSDSDGDEDDSDDDSEEDADADVGCAHSSTHG